MLEAGARETYYSCFDSFISNEDFVFTKRSGKPPLNEVNSMISFGNTALYNYIATIIYKSSLDVRVGFLHATNKRMESLNLDIAQLFKPLIVDRVVLSLVNLKMVSKEHFFVENNGGVYLNENGKRIFLRAFYEKLNTVITLKDGTRHSYSAIIGSEVSSLCNHFRHGTEYVSFRQVR